MGSSGTGRFGNYPGGGGAVAPSNSQNGMAGGAGGSAGGTGEIECPSVIAHIRLEDVAISEYYIKNNALPVRGAAVKLSNKIYKGRLVVVASQSNEIIGNLPTQYNYLIICIKSGMNYSGTVISAGTSPVPFVVVTLHA